jgi:hypothetical protein
VLNATRVLPGSGVRHVQSLGLLGFTETLHLMLSQSLGDCSPISGINPPGAASADSAFAESPIKWTIWPPDRRAQRERRICAHVTAARRNSHFIRNSPGQSVARARRLGLFAFSRFRCPGRLALARLDAERASAILLQPALSIENLLPHVTCNKGSSSP